MCNAADATRYGNIQGPAQSALESNFNQGIPKLFAFTGGEVSPQPTHTNGQRDL